MQFDQVLTERLTIEPLRASHGFELFDSFSDPRLYDHIGGNPPASAEALADRFAFISSGPPEDRPEQIWVNVVVRRRVDGKAMGRLEATIVEGRAEVAYLFGRAWWGKGYAAESMFAFQALLAARWSVADAWACTAPGNTHSIRLLQRLDYAPAPEPWPELLAYDPGDLVFARPL